MRSIPQTSGALHFSTRGEYGVRLMVELTRHHGSGPVSLAEMAEHESLPRPYLEQLVSSLREAGQWPTSTEHATLTRDALQWATLGGAKALGLERRIGSLAPGKQADIVMINCRGMNIFPALPGGDPAHVVVMYAETSDIEHVMIAGRFAKRDGRLLFPAERLARLQDELLESRQRMMKDGNYVYRPVANGPLPERYVF